MKNYPSQMMSSSYRTVILTVAFLAMLGVSCSKDHDPVIDPPDNTVTGDNKFMFCFRSDDSGWGYCSKTLTSVLGANMNCYSSDDDFSGYGVMAGIEVGKAQFVFGHNKGDNSYNKDFFIRKIQSNGEWGDITDSGSWEHNYETVMGLKVGAKGFLFGLDSYGDHHWFVQEITADGKLAGGESDNGDWNNFYASATPLYVGGKTYIFFQTTSNDNYWFISSVSESGQLSDVCDGYWGNFWEGVASVEVGGNTYLIGNRNRHTMTMLGEYFIQKINSDGTMGAETDRGTWNNYYQNLRGYSYNGKAYLFGHNTDLTGGGPWFTQEITSDGKMGATTSSGNTENEHLFFYPFNIYDPGSMRYSIGWDLSKSNGGPTRNWSSLFMDPWSGDTKFGGGAALANIDGDSGGRYDALLMGIQDIAGSDRFYYKVAWNLDNAGKAASWSGAMYGPACGGTQAGGGADITDIDGNGVPDLLLMSVDDPEGSNSFWYYIGWNLSSRGAVASWSSKMQVNGLGSFDSGGGAALGDIDKNGRPDVVFMAADNPAQDDSYWYIVGRNLDKTGKAASWSPMIAAPCDLGWDLAGAGAALADINGNGKPDLVFTSLDSPSGANNFWCYVGWDIDIDGKVTGWSSFTGPSLGNITSGGGTAIADIDKNGILDLLLMIVDNPFGKD